jgi:hypothetical protein
VVKGEPLSDDAVTVPVSFGGLDQLLDLVGGECSRVLNSTFFRRFGGTVRFTSVGATSRRCVFVIEIRPLAT